MSEKNEHIDHKNLIAKYLGGLAGKEELQLLLKWIEVNEENKKYFLQAKDIWDISGKQRNLHDIDSESAYRKFRERINKYSEENLISIQKPKARPNLVLRYMLPAAAAILIAVSIWFIFYKKVEWKVVASYEKSNVPIVLPDSSTVYLNSHTELRYPEKFKGDKRNVFLVGEAFFEITPNREKPFIVNAGKAKVEVLGTSFNVNANAENEIITVTVKSGSVLLFVEDESGDSVKSITLSSGDKGECNLISGNILKTENKNYNYLTWKTGFLTFKDTKMSKALWVIEKHYNINFNVDNEKLYNCNLTAKFDNQPIEDILEILQLAFKINIVKENKNYIINGIGCEQKENL